MIVAQESMPDCKLQLNQSDERALAIRKSATISIKADLASISY